MRRILLALPLLGACSSLKLMSAAPAESDPPGTDEAKVVVYRDSFRNSNKPYAFLDDEELLGFAQTGAWFEVRCAPGPHFFYLHGVSSSGVHATLEAGKTYYLRADSLPELFHLRLRLTPITPEMREFEEIEALLSGLERREPIDVVLDQYSESHAEDLERDLAYLLTDGSGECGVLRPEDGR